MSQSVVLLIRNKVKSRSFLLFPLLFFVCLFVCYIRLLKEQKVYKVRIKINILRNNYILIFKQYEFFFSFPRYQYVRLDGTMSIKKRQKIVDRFNDPHVSGSQETLPRFSFFFGQFLSRPGSEYPLTLLEMWPSQKEIET